MQGHNRIECTLNSRQQTQGLALNTTTPLTCFAMRIRSVYAKCVASMDTRDIECSVHMKRGGKDRYVMEKANTSMVISALIFMVLFMLLLMSEMK